MADRSYQDLKKEVWDTGRCSGCGACTAVCPADALYFDEEAHVPYPSHNGYCKQANDSVPCGACFEVCPRIFSRAADPLGDYRWVKAARSATPVPHRQSGGAVTALLANALSEDLIDAVVTISEDRVTLRPFSTVITTQEELVHTAGSRYSWWVPLLASLKSAVVDRKFRKIAVVGVPCVVQALDRMRKSEHDLVRPYGKAIRLVIGLFCTESFDYRALVEGKLRKEYAVETWKVKKLDVRGKLEIFLQDGSKVQVPLQEIEDTVRSGCHHCTDFSAVSSDISAGSVGSPDGYTTLLARTSLGESFIQNAVDRGALALSDDIDLSAVRKLAQAKIQKNQANMRD